MGQSKKQPRGWGRRVGDQLAVARPFLFYLPYEVDDTA